MSACTRRESRCMSLGNGADGVRQAESQQHRRGTTQESLDRTGTARFVYLPAGSQQKIAASHSAGRVGREFCDRVVGLPVPPSLRHISLRYISRMRRFALATTGAGDSSSEVIWPHLSTLGPGLRRLGPALLEREGGCICSSALDRASHGSARRSFG